MTISMMMEDAIFGILNGDTGKQFCSSMIASRLKIEAKVATLILKRLVSQGRIRTCIQGKRSVYYIQSQEQIDAAAKVVSRPEFKPLVGHEKLLRDISESAVAGR